MRKALWENSGLVVHVIVADDGASYFTHKEAAHGLGLSEEQLRFLWVKNRTRFDRMVAAVDSLSVTIVTDRKPEVLQCIRENKEAFGLQRVTSRTRVWTETEFLVLAGMASTDQAIQASATWVAWAKTQSTLRMADALQELRRVVGTQGEQLAEMRELLGVQASSAGRSLAYQRCTKKSRRALN